MDSILRLFSVNIALSGFCSISCFNLLTAQKVLINKKKGIRFCTNNVDIYSIKNKEAHLSFFNIFQLFLQIAVTISVKENDYGFFRSN